MVKGLKALTPEQCMKNKERIREEPTASNMHWK